MPSAPCGDAGHDCGCQQGGAFGDVGFYWLWPTFGSRPAYTVNTGAFNNERATTNASATQDFNYDSDIAPRFTVGYACTDSLGVRFRGWWYDDSATASVRRGDVAGGTFLNISGAGLFLADPGSSLSLHDNVNVSAWDLEGFKTFGCDWARVLFAGGVRHGTLKSRLDATSLDPLTTSVSNVRNSRDFEGFGPTAAYDVRAPLGGGLGLFHTLRLAFLYGHQEDFTNSFTFTPITGNSAFTHTSSERDGVRVEGEIEVGAEYNTDWNGSHFFVQGSFVGLVYTEVSFVGISVRAGITW